MSAQPDDPASRPHHIVELLEILTQDDSRNLQQLTAEDGISRQTWSNWITGSSDPSLGRVARRAATLGRKIILALADPDPEEPHDRHRQNKNP